MKFRVTMKDPDGVYDSFQEAASASAASVKGISKKEREELQDSRMDEIKEACGKWFQYDEYLTVEVDTDAGTCVVVKNGE